MSRYFGLFPYIRGRLYILLGVKIFFSLRESQIVISSNLYRMSMSMSRPVYKIHLCSPCRLAPYRFVFSLSNEVPIVLSENKKGEDEQFDHQKTNPHPTLLATVSQYRFN